MARVMKENNVENVWSRAVRMLLIAFLVFLIITFANFWYVAKNDAYDKQYISYAAELRVIIERFSRHAGEAVLKGKPDAFTYLRYRSNEFSGILEILKRGKQSSSGKITLPPSPTNIQDDQLAKLIRIWNAEKANGDIIYNNRDLIISAKDTVNTISDLTNKIELGFLEVLRMLENRSASGREYVDIATQIFNIQAINQDVEAILDVEANSGEQEARITKQIENFQNKLQEFKRKYSSDVINAKLIEIENSFILLKDKANEIVKTGQSLIAVNAAYADIYKKIPSFLEETASLERAYTEQSSKRWINSVTAGIFGAITILLLIALIYCMYRDNQFRLEASTSQNRRLQSEIQQLVMELKDLANGNLTVKATAMSNGVTTSIADAINYALNALRRLVKGINQTSLKVSSSAEQVKKVSNELVRAMNSQAQEIVNTTSSVSTMATSIDQVSLNAKKSAKVAEDSVQIAHEGAEIVQNTIGGMERIREQIRETEKRIQRLGESSQEIGEIVSLIDGISEQTNILSLNAAIQAAMAGDAGMGFAVVADEVQQLAVKSSQAAKEVESIVKAIRGDTARAFESMGHAISEVTTGTKLAHDAGHALGKIETVSKNLADLIQGISEAAEEQAKVSGKISKMMEIIEAISRETASGTANTADSIDNLASLVRDLHVSVKEFKLPEESHG